MSNPNPFDPGPSNENIFSHSQIKATRRVPQVRRLNLGLWAAGDSSIGRPILSILQDEISLHFLLRDPLHFSVVARFAPPVRDSLFPLHTHPPQSRTTCSPTHFAIPHFTVIDLTN
jgi:hypothetical protein